MELTIITKSSTYDGRTIKTGRTVLKSIRAERELRASSSSPQLGAQPAATCNGEENGRQEAPHPVAQIQPEQWAGDHWCRPGPPARPKGSCWRLLSDLKTSRVLTGERKAATEKEGEEGYRHGRIQMADLQASKHTKLRRAEHLRSSSSFHHQRPTRMRAVPRQRWTIPTVLEEPSTAPDNCRRCGYATHEVGSTVISLLLNLNMKRQVLPAWAPNQTLGATHTLSACLATACEWKCF